MTFKKAELRIQSLWLCFCFLFPDSQHGDCSSSCCGNGRQRCGQLQHDSVHQLGLRLPGRPGYQTEAKKHPLPAAGQRRSVLLSRMQNSQEEEKWVQFFNHSLWVACPQMTSCFFSLSLSGGSGGGELKEKGSCSDYKAESYFVLSTCPYESCFLWAHYRCLLRHLPGHRIQPGKRCERRVMMHMRSESPLWPFSIPSLTNRGRVGSKVSWVWFMSIYLPSSSLLETLWCRCCVTRSPW